MRVDSAFAEAAVAAVKQAAAATGVDFGQLLETARRESGFDANARAKTSSAAGLFQFIESAWLGTVEKYGAKYGLDPKAPRQTLLDLRFDPDIAAKMAGELTRENESVLTRKLGRTPSAGELYAAHVLGPEGARKLIAAPGAIAADVLPQAAAANRSIFYTDGKALSAEAVLAKLDLKPGAAPSAPAPVQAATPIAALTGLAGSFGEAFGADLWRIALNAYRRGDDPESLR